MLRVWNSFSLHQPIKIHLASAHYNCCSAKYPAVQHVHVYERYVKDLRILAKMLNVWVNVSLETHFSTVVGGVVTSWSVRSSQDHAVWVQDLARAIVLCSWVTKTHLISLTVPLSTQVYKWVPANFMLGIALWWTSIPSSGSILSLCATLTLLSCLATSRMHP